jgi:hypothetical protein
MVRRHRKIGDCSDVVATAEEVPGVQCLLLARFGHAETACRCPLIGVAQISRRKTTNPANDLTET